MQPAFRLKNVLTAEMHLLSQSSSVIGRNQHCEIRIDSDALSRNHASLHVTEHGVVIEDLNSTNGTYVNNIRIDSPVLLSDGDVVTIGNHRMVLIEPALSPSPPKEPKQGLAEELAMYEFDDRTSNRTMIKSSFAHSLGLPAENILAKPEVEEPESLEAMIVRALSSKTLDHERVPAVLILKNSRKRGMMIELKLPHGSNQEWAVGRSQLSDVVLDDPTVSNLHAIIAYNANTWSICDNDSTNGIKLNGELIGGNATCHHGDVITVGGIELIFYILRIS